MNVAQSLRRHDWAYRWEEMLRVLDLPVPSGVAERKARLAALADVAEEELARQTLRPARGQVHVAPAPLDEARASG
jgi:acyl carrier protein phosphodiesterase